ncbi:hypothetical protein DFH08DRAFT_822847 [Mycena albidolilacea]|jgi:hypothetical protein|uniref:Uncharacterized protein n=1 Tax=Mycena albidolilacea TaxID=1033008 RepID=A0AAD6Z740_9AGAR|nr:hypothetical protein DFH08DRAFT_822847 [Mycena albidolilacea]
MQRRPGSRRVQSRGQARVTSGQAPGIECVDGGDRTCGQQRASAWAAGIERAWGVGWGGRRQAAWGYRVRMGCAMSGQAARFKGVDSERERAGEGQSQPVLGVG